MKKRSACKILAGVVTLGVLTTGHCGQITLTGNEFKSMRVELDATGLVMKGLPVTYDIGVSCSLCMAYTGPCITVPVRDLRLSSRLNVKDVNLKPAVGYTGTVLRWAAARPDRENRLAAAITCDNSSKPEWGWVNVGFHRDRRYPESDLRVTATNLLTGIAETHEWIRTGWTWYPGWDAVNTGGGVGAGGTVRISYPEEVVLRGHGSRARVLYDIVGPVSVSARVDRLPVGLSCARTSDGVVVEPGVTAGVGAGDSITCTNVRHKVGTLSDTLSVTAMIR